MNWCVGQHGTASAKNLQGVDELVVFVEADPGVPDDGPVLVLQLQLQVPSPAVLEVAERLFRNLQPDGSKKKSLMTG